MSSNSREQELLKASDNGRTDEVKRLLDAGVNIEAKRLDTTALMRAIENGHVATAKLLIRRGADVNAKDDYSGDTPLLYAIQYYHRSEDKDKKDIVKLLLSKGADFNATNANGFTALMYAVMKRATHIINILLEKPVDVNAVNIHGETALIIAGYFGMPPVIIQALLRRGANINAKTTRGITALTEAINNGHKATVKVLLDNGADVNVRNSRGATPLMFAAWNMERDTRESFEIVGMLLSKGADVNAATYANGDTVLMGSINPAIAQELIRRGANVNAKNNDGMTPLMFATQWGRTETIELLIRRGADVNARDNEGKTALSYARDEDNYAIVEMLLEKGAVDDRLAFLDAVPYGPGVPSDSFEAKDPVSMASLNPSERSYYITKNLIPGTQKFAYAYSGRTMGTLLLDQSRPRSPMSRLDFSVDDVRAVRSLSAPPPPPATQAPPPVPVPRVPAPTTTANRVPLGGRSRCPAGYARNRRDRSMCVKK